MTRETHDRLKSILRVGIIALILLIIFIIAENDTQYRNQKQLNDDRNQGYTDKTVEALICDIKEEPSRLRSEHPESSGKAYVTITFDNRIMTICIPLNKYNNWKDCKSVSIETLYNEKYDEYIFYNGEIIVNDWYLTDLESDIAPFKFNEALLNSH